MIKIIKKDFFDRDTKIVAQDLLGKFLVRKIGKKEVALIITETEVYDGFKDKASHASIGRTERNKVMFSGPATIYVYLTYGMHFMLNIVTREKDYPAAVLVRGIVLQDKRLVLNGPAKLTKFLKIDKKLNNKNLGKKSGLWVEDRGVKIGKIKKIPRVGVSYAGPLWASKKLRFLLEYETL